MSSYRRNCPPLFDGPYKGGYVVLVEVGDYCEEVDGQVENEKLKIEVDKLVYLRRTIGDAWLIPVFTGGEEEEDNPFRRESGSLDVEEKDGGVRSIHQDIPARFLKNVLDVEIPLPPGRKEETEMLDGPTRVGDEVWLMSLRRIDKDVLPLIETVVTQADLILEIQNLESLRNSYPSGKYRVLEIEEISKSDYCLLETPRGEQVRVFGLFLAPCNRPPQKKFGRI